MKSEAELDEQLAALHFRINHESISLNEEKKALATIKKLEQQRERVGRQNWRRPALGAGCVPCALGQAKLAEVSPAAAVS